MAGPFLLSAVLAPARAVAAQGAAPTASSAGAPVAVRAPAQGTLRVCADPDNLPFSNRKEQGFENHLMTMIGHTLGRTVHYYWSAKRKHFLKQTLEAGHCDVVMGIPTRSDRVLTTRPYYRSTYVLIYRKNAGYALRSLDDPRLRKLSIGVRAIGDDFNDLPAGSVLANRGIVDNVVTYNIFNKYGRMNSPATIINAVAQRHLDAAIVWGPLGGYFAKHQPTRLAVVPLTPRSTVLPFTYSISLGVRKGDAALRARLDQALQRRRGKIHTLLVRYGVPLLALPDTRPQHAHMEDAEL